MYTIRMQFPFFKKRRCKKFRKLYVHVFIVAVLFFVLLILAQWQVPYQTEQFSSSYKFPTFSIHNDPQYIIINVADFYFTDWQADEETWQNQVKPEVIEKLQEIKDAVGSSGNEDGSRKLAWSTLLEYTDFPLDEPSNESNYALQARRILEIADETEFPVFMPLNGFQWWNQVPELWNYWDYDGNQTLGCENDYFEDIVGYAGSEPIYRCKFNKLRDPEFRERFISGYNEENKWNVEWQDYETPMYLNWRNWGAGGFQLAPPPNIADHTRTELSYHDFQEARFALILDQITDQLSKWQQQNKLDLFVGFSIGTEVSLNASVTKADEFIPYGYRSIQDTLCPTDQPTCGEEKDWSKSQLHEYRKQVVFEYLQTLSCLAVRKGIPKQRIYTHVWSEASPGEPRYTNYFESAINLYSRPGLSLYGKAQNPLGFSVLSQTLEKHNQPVWAAPEFSTDKDGTSWSKALRNTLSNQVNPAQLITVYNWREHVGTPAVSQIALWLKQEQKEYLYDLSPVIPQNEVISFDPQELRWDTLHSDKADKVELIVYKHEPASMHASPYAVFRIDGNKNFWETKTLSSGVYWWYVRREGVTEQGDTIVRTSQPQVFVKSLQLPKTYEPLWMRMVGGE